MQCPDFPGLGAVWDGASAVTYVALQGAARLCISCLDRWLFEKQVPKTTAVANTWNKELENSFKSWIFVVHHTVFYRVVWD